MMKEIILKATENHEICEQLIAARKATAIVANQYLLVVNLMNGESDRTDRSLEEEKDKLRSRTVLAVRKVLRLNSTFHFLDRFYHLKGERKWEESLRLCLDFDARMSMAEYEMTIE